MPPKRIPAGAPLLLRAKFAGKFISDEKLGQLIGVSRRTIDRYSGKHMPLTPRQLQALAVYAHPMDRALALDLARAAKTTLVAWGLEAPPPAPAPTAPTAPPPAPVAARPSPRLADTAVCAAADVLKLPPAEVRAALHAAIQVAREVGLDLQTLEAGLAPKSKPAAPR